VVDRVTCVVEGLNNWHLELVGKEGVDDLYSERRRLLLLDGNPLPFG